MATATATVNIVLKGALSHTVKREGQAELKIVKGRPYPTTDPELVAYFEAKPQLFTIKGKLAPPVKEAVDKDASADAEDTEVEARADAPAAPKPGKKTGGKKAAGKKAGGKRSPVTVEDEDED